MMLMIPEKGGKTSRKYFSSTIRLCVTVFSYPMGAIKTFRKLPHESPFTHKTHI